MLISESRSCATRRSGLLYLPLFSTPFLSENTRTLKRSLGLIFKNRVELPNTPIGISLTRVSPPKGDNREGGGAGSGMFGATNVGGTLGGIPFMQRATSGCGSMMWTTEDGRKEAVVNAYLCKMRLDSMLDE